MMEEERSIKRMELNQCFYGLEVFREASLNDLATIHSQTIEFSNLFGVLRLMKQASFAFVSFSLPLTLLPLYFKSFHGDKQVSFVIDYDQAFYLFVISGFLFFSAHLMVKSQERALRNQMFNVFNDFFPRYQHLRSSIETNLVSNGSATLNQIYSRSGEDTKEEIFGRLADINDLNQIYFEIVKTILKLHLNILNNYRIIKS